MKISTKGRYATRALAELARHYGEGPVLLRDIAKKQQIPLQYLEHLINPMAAAGLVMTTRGAKGGIRLIQPPENIRISQVVEIMEGPIIPVNCIAEPGSCQRSGECVTRDVWTEVQQAIYGVLNSVTIKDLVERQHRKDECAQHNFDI